MRVQKLAQKRTTQQMEQSRCNASFLFKVKVKVKVRKRPMVCFVNVASRQTPLSYWPRVWETHFFCRLRSWIQELKWWMTFLRYRYLTTWKAQVATCVQIGTWPSIGPFHCFQLKRERNGPREKEAEKKDALIIRNQDGFARSITETVCLIVWVSAL